MKFNVAVEVRSLEGVADPEGQTVERALPALGFDAVEAVHVGRLIRFVVDAHDEVGARDVAQSLCDRLLVNSVIERGAITEVSST